MDVMTAFTEVSFSLATLDRANHAHEDVVKMGLLVEISVQPSSITLKGMVSVISVILASHSLTQMGTERARVANVTAVVLIA